MLKPKQQKAVKKNVCDLDSGFHWWADTIALVCALAGLVPVVGNIADLAGAAANVGRITALEVACLRNEEGGQKMSHDKRNEIIELIGVLQLDVLFDVLSATPFAGLIFRVSIFSTLCATSNLI